MSGLIVAVVSKFSEESIQKFGIIHPYSKWKRRWDFFSTFLPLLYSDIGLSNILVAVLLMYTVFMAPMQACFNFMIDGPITIVDQLIDVLFGLDIVVSFSSAYIQKDKIVVSRSLIASHYLRTWFFFDFIAVLPVQYLVQNRVNKLAKIPRLLRGTFSLATRK